MGAYFSSYRRTLAYGVGQLGQPAGETALREGEGGGRKTGPPGRSVPIRLGFGDGGAQQRTARVSPRTAPGNLCPPETDQRTGKCRSGSSCRWFPDGGGR